MGLDTVELVIAIEDEFLIQIPDQEAERMRTVGDIHNYVCEAVRIKTRPTPSDQEIWERVKTIVVEQLGVKPEQVTPDADVVRDLGAD